MSKRRRSGRLAIVQADVVDDTRVGSAALKVLVTLGTYTTRDGWAYPKQKTLARRLGLSQQAVSRQLGALVALGYVEIEPWRSAGTGLRIGSRYRVRRDFELPDEHRRLPLSDEESHNLMLYDPQPEVVDATTSEVVHATTSEVVTLNGLLERPEPTGVLNGASSRPPPQAEEERRQRRRRRDEDVQDDVAETPPEPLTPLTAQDRKQWQKARPKLPGNAELLTLLEPVGRLTDGGLKIEVPQGYGHLLGYRHLVSRALADVGDEHAEAATIVEAR